MARVYPNSKAGAWYSYGSDRIGQGKENSRVYLQEHPEVAVEIEDKLRAMLLPKKATAEAEAVSE